MRTLFLPGLLSDGRVWQEVADRLNLPLLLADLTRDDTIGGMAARALFDFDGPISVMGHSMGGRVAIEMARLQPGRVTSLVLANTGHTSMKPGEEEKRGRLVDLGRRDMRELAEVWLPPMLAPDRIADLSLVDDLTQMVIKAGPEVHERQIRALLSRPDAGKTLPAITCPVLLMTGAQDGWSPEAQHREMAAMTSDSTVEIINDAGHFLPIEQPDRTAGTIQKWRSGLGD